jgi:hypothetical protein
MADGSTAAPRIKIVAPSASMNRPQRLSAAYALVQDVAPLLAMNSDPTNGLKIVARAAAVTIGQAAGKDEAVQYLNRLAREIREPRAPIEDVRAYSKERMMQIATAFWRTLLVELRGDDDVVIMPTAEILEAMALLAGMILSSSPQARVPSQLRDLCERHAKDMITRTRQAIAKGADRTFAGTISDLDVMQ